MKRYSKKHLALSSLLACGTLLAVQGVFAHGYMLEPKSRGIICRDNWMGIPLCKAMGNSEESQAIWNPQGFQYNGEGNRDYENTIPDEKICGGSEYPSMNLPTARFTKTAIQPDSAEKIKLTYEFTAWHKTDHIRYYITKPGFNPNQKIRWQDLEEMATFPNVANPQGAKKLFTNMVKLPSGQRGTHTIVTMWPTAAGHSQETFISCADVDIQGSAVPNAWTVMGEGLVARQMLKAGSEVKFRLFDPTTGSSAGESMLTLDKEMQAAEWLYALANKVNEANLPVKIGTLQSGNVVLPTGKTSYQVYTKSAQFNYALDVKAHVEVVPGNGPQAVAGADTNVVATTSAGFAYKLDGSKSLRAVAYQWEWVSGLAKLRKANEMIAEAVVAINQTGESVFKLTVTDKDGNKHSSTKKVIVAETSVTISGATSISEGQLVSLKAQPNFANSPTYSWKVLDSNNAVVLQETKQQLNLATLAVGNYQATVNVSSTHGGRSAKATQSIEVVKKGEVTPPVNPPVADISGPAQVEGGKSATLDASRSTASNGAQLTYDWKVSPNLDFTKNGAKLNFTAPKVTQDTRFTFTLTVSDGKLSSNEIHPVLVKKAASEVGDGCAGIPEWQPITYRIKGTPVQYKGRSYASKWWAEPHHTPGAAGSDGQVWQDNGVCR